MPKQTQIDVRAGQVWRERMPRKQGVDVRTVTLTHVWNSYNKREDSYDYVTFEVQGADGIRTRKKGSVRIGTLILNWNLVSEEKE